MTTTKKTAKKSRAQTAKAAADAGRTRTSRPYPASSFSDALALGNAVMVHAAGERVRRLTLLEKMAKETLHNSADCVLEVSPV